MREIVEIGRGLIGQTPYVFWEEHCRPPDTLNCYLFVWWSYQECGLEIPRGLSGQVGLGQWVADPTHRCDGDIIFTNARWGRVVHERAPSGVGHNGILTARGTVIHASQRNRNVVEVSIDNFLQRRLFRGICCMRSVLRAVA